MSNPILVPLINPNEPEALLANLYIEEGQQISTDDLICTFETTKSTADLNAEFEGYVIGLQVAEGQTLRAGELICYLAESTDWIPPQTETATTSTSEDAKSTEMEIPAGLRITQPALKFAQEKRFDLNQLPIGPMVTESTIRALLEKPASSDRVVQEGVFDPTAIFIYGGGGHGKACLDLILTLGSYRVLGFIDDSRSIGEEIMGLPVLGGGEKLNELYAQGLRLAVNAVGGIGNVAVRIKVFNKLAAAGFSCPTIVHPTAFIESSANLAAGVQVFPHAYIGSEAQVGFGSIVNTSAIVSHDCTLGKIVNISPGAILAGEVTCGDGSLIGMGVTVNLQVKIGAGARVGNSATVKSDVPKNGIVRAGGIWPE